MKYFTEIDGIGREFTFTRRGDRLTVDTADRSFDVDVVSLVDGAAFSLLVDGRSFDVILEPAATRGRDVIVQIEGERFPVTVEDERERAAQAVAGQRGGGRQEIIAAMPGIVVEVKVEVGATVSAGEVVVVLEAMKMQNPLGADADGVVSAVHVATGDTVSAGAVLVEVDPPPSEESSA